jgi:hypothetical protein
MRRIRKRQKKRHAEAVSTLNTSTIAQMNKNLNARNKRRPMEAASRCRNREHLSIRQQPRSRFPTLRIKACRC